MLEPSGMKLTDKLRLDDLVVACDGATSRTRAMGLGCGIRDYVHPSNCWGAYFTIEQDLLEGSKIGNAISAVGGRVIM